MARFDIIDKNEEDYFDILVEAGFEQLLSPSDITQLLQICTDIATDKKTSSLFEGFTELKVAQTEIRVLFRVSKKTEDWQLSGEEIESLSRQKMQFIFYFFARIDQHYKLEDVPFPANFRAYLSLPEYL